MTKRVKQQEKSKQEVDPIPEVGAKVTEDGNQEETVLPEKKKNENSGKSRLSEKQDSSQELILLEENIGGIRQQKNRGTRETQESVNKTLTKTTDKIQKPVVDYSKKICVLLNKNIKLIIIEAYTEMSSGMQDRLSRIDLEKVK